MFESTVNTAELLQTSICNKNLHVIWHCIWFAIRPSHHIPAFTASQSLAPLPRPFLFPNLTHQLAPPLPASAVNLMVGWPTSVTGGNSLVHIMPINTTLGLQYINMQPRLSNKGAHTQGQKNVCSHWSKRTVYRMSRLN